jgi:anthranilate phosphoribosyltransferase
VLNAGAALLVAGSVPDLEAGIDTAVEAIDSGAATATLDRLIAFTQQRAPAAAS